MEQVKQIVTQLEALADPQAIEGMARFGITPERTYAVRIPNLRSIAKGYKGNHELALALWDIDTRETRILASMIADPKKATEELMESWAMAFDYWEICDQCVMNLFEKTPAAWDLALKWSNREETFVKRAGFVIMARLAVSDKKAEDKCFLPLLTATKEQAWDNRNDVKKAVNWAIRQIGKRNLNLHKYACTTAQEIRIQDTPSARWIAKDALRELKSDAVLGRLGGNADV